MPSWRAQENFSSYKNIVTVEDVTDMMWRNVG
jgi:hypothetical protein